MTVYVDSIFPYKEVYLSTRYPNLSLELDFVLL
jgi:hypothetical protein